MTGNYFSTSLKKKIQPILYLLPAMFFLMIFTYYPIVRALYISLFQWSTDYPQKVFNGVRNYAIVCFLLDSGVRNKELRNLYPKDVTLKIVKSDLFGEGI